MESSAITSIAGGATQGVAGIAMGVIGYYQRKKAAEMEKDLVRPEIEIPDYMQPYLTQAQKMAMQGMPEQQRQRYLDQIARSASYAIAGNVNRGEGLQGVSAANMAMNDANADLMMRDSQQRLANIANYQNAQLNYAGFLNDKYLKEFEYNKNQPYQNKAAAIRALYGAGMQNGAAGLQTVADSGATVAGAQGSGGGGQPYNNNYYYQKVPQQEQQQVVYQQPQTYTTNPYAGQQQQQLQGGQNMTSNPYKGW